MQYINLYIIDLSKTNMEDIASSSFISNEDKKEVEVYKIESARNQHLASRYLKNKYIGDYYLDEKGKPLSKDKYFNVSHSGNLIVLAVDDNNPIGVDVELIKQVEDKFIKYVTNQEEFEYIKNQEDFFKIWTNKESLLKAIGSGIDKRLNTVPGLPLNSGRHYENKDYMSHTIKYEYYVITVTKEGKEDFEISIIV